MSMVIANNMQAINTKRQFATSSRGMSGAMEKLSSGYKINTGKDDPSGLLISEKLRSQINGLKRAQQNTEEAINVMGIAEGALNEMNSILKKMKALAIHSNNTGVTSPDQIAADQAEMDSAIQTLDRIAQTTKFSDQTLLNGSKDIAYDQDTLIKGTQQNSLVNTRESNFSQIFKRDNYSVSINFTGTSNANSVSGIGDVDFSQQAMKAYLEVDTAKTGVDGKANLTQVKDGAFTQDQAFTLTGSKGSRSFKFKKGETVATMVQQIKSVADSTGIDASLVFNSDQRVDKVTGSGTEITPYTVTTQISGMRDANGEEVVIELSAANDKDKLQALQNALGDKKLSFEVEVVTAGTSTTAEYKLFAVVDGTDRYDLTAGATWTGGTFTAQALTGVTGPAGDILDALQDLTLSTNNAMDGVQSFTNKITMGADTNTAAQVLDGLYGTASNGEVKLDTTAVDFNKIYAGLKDEDKAAFATALDAGNLKIKVEATGDTQADLGLIISLEDTSGKTYLSQAVSQATLGTATNGTPGTTTGSPVTLTGALAGAIITVTGATGYTAGSAINTGAGYTATALTAAAPVTIGVGGTKSSGTVAVVTTKNPGQTGGSALNTDAARSVGDVAVFNNTIEKGTGAVAQGVSGVTITAAGANTVQFGMNTDGQGRIYVKFLDDNSFELYKDSSLSAESKVASGINGQAIKAANNSGLDGITLDLAGADLAGKKGVYLTFGGVEGTSNMVKGDKTTDAGVVYNGDVVGAGGAGSATFNEDLTLITGIELGTNTSEAGQIYLKNVYTMDDKTGQATVQVFAYKHKDMKDEDMVAKSEVYNTLVPDLVNGGSDDAGSMTIVLNEVRNADNTAGTGLGIVLSVDTAAFSGLTKSATLTGDMTFTNLGARIYTQDYGSAASLKVTADKGAIFTQYGTAGDNTSASLIDAGEKGTIVEKKGQDATLSINGAQIKTTGLQIKMATQDIQADFTFNQGKVGSTTLAQVGYGDGSIFTKIGALNLGNADLASTAGTKYEGMSGLLANAGHVTNENLGNFQGGMQLQLGEGAGDQDRTVVAIKDMTTNNLGRVSKGGYWETGSAVYSNRTFTMKDVLGGGLASLSVNATLSMSIIDQAISDVSETRAIIGATQANLLQTNSNNLSVTIENITKTESGIRDADMADEMTEFTKQQVLQNAAMSMMSQANQASQNVLQLLR